MSNPRIDEYGNKRWYVHGQLYRLDGPAVERASGAKVWYVRGKLHRLDGPAIEYTNGYKAWYVNGEKASGSLGLLKHGAKLEDIAEYLTPREIALCRT